MNNRQLMEFCIKTLISAKSLFNIYSSYNSKIAKSLRNGHEIYIWKELYDHFNMIYLYAEFIFKNTKTYEKYLAYENDLKEMIESIHFEIREANEFVKHPYGYTVKASREKMKRAQNECRYAYKIFESHMSNIKSKYIKIQDELIDQRIKRELLSEATMCSLIENTISNLLYIIYLSLKHEQKRIITP